MQVRKWAPGLWGWTAEHPDWTQAQGGPEGWDREVGSVYYEPPGDAAVGIVLIDPLAPAAGSDDRERFFAALDRDVERVGRPLAILAGNRYHGRSAAQLLERYRATRGVSLFAPTGVESHPGLPLTSTFDAGDPLPGGLTAHTIEGLNGPEVAFFISAHSALVFADAVLGAGHGRVRLAPRSWAAAGAEAGRLYDTRFRPSVRRLLELQPELLLTSHGEPVASDGVSGPYRSS